MIWLTEAFRTMFFRIDQMITTAPSTAAMRRPSALNTPPVLTWVTSASMAAISAMVFCIAFSGNESAISSGVGPWTSSGLAG
jgi:hypothetical protein